MKHISFFASFLIISILFTSLAYSAPFLYSPVPKNNSYVTGGPTGFYINITESNLNATSVLLYIKAADEASFEEFDMSCSNPSVSDWVCNTTVPFGIVGSDTAELFYFNASDNLGSIGNNGTSGNPLKVTIDKNPPNIVYVNPINNSWVNGIEKIELKVTDASSGVNFSTVNYSFDNSTWKNMTNNTNFYADWNTSSLSNNQTAIVYSKASDNASNTRYSWINVSVDNEAPKITVVKPSQNQKSSGIIQLQVNATDDYSGISAVSFSVGNLERNMDCIGNVCDEYLDTRLVHDGGNTIIFNASDKAGNSALASVNVSIDNTIPYVTIDSPSNNAYVSGKIFINASVSAPSGIVQYVHLHIEKSGYSSSWMSMNESGNYKYNYLLDTDQLEEGIYKITVKVINTLGNLINSSITMNIDRTKPVLTITSPELYAKGILRPQLIATDEFKLNPTVTFNISNFSSSISCAEQLGGKRIVCNGNVNSSLFRDGYQTLTFYVQDVAGNKNSASKEIKVDNNPPVLKYLKIDPSFAERPSIFKFYLDLDDAGSYVKTSKLVIQHPSGLRENIDLNSSSGIWTGEKAVATLGIHTLDVEATDLNDNTLVLSKTGYLYVGSVNCGNSICESIENFCICPNDCERIKCESNEVVDCGSGVPKCYDAILIQTITQNITNITIKKSDLYQNITEGKGKIPNIFLNLKISIPIGLAVIAIIAILIYRSRVRKSEQRPWYETIK